MKIYMETLGLAGEFAVASELCKRGIYAQLTLGLRRRTDILVETEESMLRIQVKSKQGKEWPGCEGIYGKDIVLIFVDFENKGENERPDFYILTVDDWKNIIEKELKDKVKKGEVKIDAKNMPIWKGRWKGKDRWKGLNVKPEMIVNYKEKWDKIKKN